MCATLEDALRKIESLCAEASTPYQCINRHIYDRLFDVYNRMVKMKALLKSSSLDNYGELVSRFHSDLLATIASKKLIRFAMSRQQIDNSYSLYSHVDTVVDLLDLPKDEPVHTWKEKWSEYRQQQIDALIVKLNDLVALMKELEEGEEDPKEALTLLLFELHEHRTSYASIPFTVLNRARNELFKDVSSLLYPWFIPSYEVQFDAFSEFNRGSFGSVHSGKWFGSDVAIKKVLTDNADVNHVATFQREVDIWFRLFHPHIVNLYGACDVGELFFVCEYASNGQLDHYLRKYKHQTWQKLYEACLGLQYLHYRNIVYSDLKCNNILVGKDGKAKLTDFGLSSKESVDEQMSADDENGKQVGGPRWKVPEVLMGEKAMFASDVYSFAMCIIEAVTVKRMCHTDPEQRLSITDAAEKLKVFAEQEAATPMDVIAEEELDYPVDCNYDSCGISIATD